MASKGTTIFIIFALLWQIAVGVIYGLFFNYNTTEFSKMSNVTQTYAYATTSSASTNFLADLTQPPYPLAVIAFAFIILIVGFALVAGYIEKATVTGMAFTLLIFALTVQNFFIFRNFWQRISVSNPNASADFTGQYYSKVNYINSGNSQTNYNYSSASFLDALGASLAMYAGYTAVIGRIGLGQVFFLTWIGTFLYQLNSQILFRLFLLDNGYPLRAFAYGGALGLVSSLVLGGKELTKDNPNYKSSYNTMALSFLGIIFVWCAFPVLILSDTYNSNGNTDSTKGNLAGMIGQVNIWLCLAASVLGCYTASAFVYRKFSIHDMIFASITGAIAFSSSTNINYNPGCAMAIGYGVGFICSIAQTRIRHKINENGVIDSNNVIFHFLFPSFLAAIFSAILSGIGDSAIYFKANSKIFSQAENKLSSRSAESQGGFQIIAFLISIGIGIAAGIIIGLIYKALNDRTSENMFNDEDLYQYPKVNADQKIVSQEEM